MILSVVIVNYRGWDILKECLDSLSCLETATFQYEVVIVDNHSNDGNLPGFTTRYPAFRFIENRGNYGFANGNNLGAEHTTGKYLLYLNPDTIINLEAITSMVAFAKKNPEYHIISTQQINEQGKKENPFGTFPVFSNITGPVRAFSKLFYFHKNLINSCGKEPVLHPDWVSGSVLMIQRESFEKLHGWDEDYWLYYEDIDLCKRAWNQDLKIAFLCDVSIIHQHGGITRRIRKYIAYFKTEVLKSRHLYVHKHFRGKRRFFIQFFLILNTLFFEQLILGILGLVFFPFRPARVHFFIYFHLWVYYVRVICKGNWISGSRFIKLSD